MQIHNLIVGILFLGVVAGCVKQLQESPDVLAARRTINELVDVRIRRDSSGYWIELEGVSKAINAITNLAEREAEVLTFARKVLEWGKDKPIIGGFFNFCLEKGHKGGEKLQEKAGKGLYFALFLFVGIPLPGTGAWTGTLAASILDMDFKKSVLAVIGGVVLAGVIMGILSAGVFSVVF